MVLPPSEIPWIISQPESVLSAQETHRQLLQSDWTLLNENIVKNPIHEQVIRGNMVRKLEAFTSPVMDELRHCFEDYWGTATGWHEVNIWESMLKLFARTSNRMFVGLPLCREEDFLDGCRNFATNVMISGFFLKLMPTWVKPVLGYLAIAPNWWHYRNAAKFLIPLIESRLKQMQQMPEKDPADLLPNDFVTWSIVSSLESNDPRERTPELIAKRTMTTNFAAIHTTTMTSTNLLIDLLGSDHERGYLEALGSEIAEINKANSGEWSKSALAAMTRTDSALRESMRLSGFVVFGVERKVVAKAGVTLPDGTKIPYWGNIAVPAWGIHHDKDLYENPLDYDAFRFSRHREALGEANQNVHVGEEGLVEGEKGFVRSKEEAGIMTNGGDNTQRDLTKVLEGKNLSTVTTGSQFMQFGMSFCQELEDMRRTVSNSNAIPGHGKLSCPGRFFAVQEIKLMMAYMLLNYDIKYLPSKPAPQWMGVFSMPNTKAKIQIRRKPDAAGPL